MEQIIEKYTDLKSDNKNIVLNDEELTHEELLEFKKNMLEGWWFELLKKIYNQSYERKKATSELVKIYKNHLNIGKDIIFNEKIQLKVKNILDTNYKIEKYNSDNITEKLMEELLEVANDWFGIKMLLEDVQNHIYKSEDIFILKINNNIVWFSSLSRLWDFIYRFWTVIKNNFQNNWLYKKLSEVIFEDNKKYFLRTQNQNVIKSLQKTFDNVIYWEEALIYIKEYYSEEEINNFMLEHWDNEKSLDEKWIFRGVYGWKMWDKSRINYIDEEFYSSFSTNNWDSLLVIYYNN